MKTNWPVIIAAALFAISLLFLIPSSEESADRDLARTYRLNSDNGDVWDGFADEHASHRHLVMFALWGASGLMLLFGMATRSTPEQETPIGT